MSELEAAQLQQGGDAEEEDCTLCLEPLPPFWAVNRRVTSVCCGKCCCVDCKNKQDAYLQRAAAEGSVGKAEVQLNKYCPNCRTEKPKTESDKGRALMDGFEKGRLPPNLYCVLGGKLADGLGVERDVEKSVEILMLGAEKGDPKCKHELGRRYQRGEDGLPRSPEESKKWYLAATEQGHAIAEYNLALMLIDEGNDAEYLRHLRGSASKGYGLACYNLGVDYYGGKCGLEQSTEEAIRWLTPAAERGDANCMELLGYIMCSDEHGLDDQWHIDGPNFTRGVHWLCRAAELGDEAATTYLRELREYASTVCFRCDKDAPAEKAFLRCSRCRAAWYCSKGCQVQHWKEEGGHKQFCIKWRPQK